MPTSRLHRLVVICSFFLLSILIFGSAACKQGRVKLSESTNSLGITMVSIPAGSFMMGEPSELDHMGAQNSAFPQHSVSVPAFQISKTEVTVGQYKKFLEGKGREGLKELQDATFLKYNSFGDDAPVVNPKVREFIDWLNGIEGGGYRLPTEAEWEYACRAGGNEEFCGGDDVNVLAWHGGNSGGKMHPVAQKKPNSFGLYDMSGNASEWVQDCWKFRYHDAPTDGSALGGTWDEKRTCEFRVVRGGSAFHAVLASRATLRDRQSPKFSYNNIGIRLVRTN